MRRTRVGRHVRAGCEQCHGGNAHWFSKNAQAVAARHHDATGHETWVEVDMHIRYGVGSTQPGVLSLPFGKA
jgi:hypothetical protein